MRVYNPLRCRAIEPGNTSALLRKHLGRILGVSDYEPKRNLQVRAENLGALQKSANALF